MKVRWWNVGAQMGLWHHAKNLELTHCDLAIPERDARIVRDSTNEHVGLDALCPTCFPYSAHRTPAAITAKRKRKGE